MEKSFKEYLENKEDQNLNVLFEEGNTAEVVGKILGIGATGMIAAYGGTLVVYACVKGIKGLMNIWSSIIENIKGLKNTKPLDFAKKIRNDTLVKQEVNRISNNKREYSDVLQELYAAIDGKDFVLLKEKYNELDGSFKKMPAVKQILINEISKSLGEPPVWPPSPGNKTYKTIRDILGLAEAKAAATAVSYNALRMLDKEKAEE